MAIKTISEDDILASLDPRRTAVIMVDVRPDHATGPNAGGHILGAGGLPDIAQTERHTFGTFKTAAVIQFDTARKLEDALRPYGIDPGRGWISDTGARDLGGAGNADAPAKTFARIAAAEGASVLYDGGLADMTKAKSPTVKAWIYEHDGMIHDRDHPASIRMTFQEELSREPWNATPIELDAGKLPKRGDLVELASEKTGDKYWAHLDADTLKALKGIAEPRISIIASRQDVSDAITMLNDRDGSMTPTGRVLAGLAPAIAQVQWAKGEYGRLKETGEVKSGKDALIALRDGFGKGEHRRVTLDADKVGALLKMAGPILKGTYEDVLETSAQRDAAYQAKKAVKPVAKQADGATR